jgi:signal transduction histidine kinase
VQRAGAFTADASHQLRTPLTALRLNLESLADSDRDAVDAAMAEADRLEATIDELVALTQLDATERITDLGALVEERVAAWRHLASGQGRQVEVEVLPTPAVPVRAAAVGQALQVLLDNAIEHGRGTVTVRVAPTLPGTGDARGVRICVTDEGPGIDPRHARARVGADRGRPAPGRARTRTQARAFTGRSRGRPAHARQRRGRHPGVPGASRLIRARYVLRRLAPGMLGRSG